MLGLIVLMVIRLAGSASAECGWVLWQHTTPVETACRSAWQGASFYACVEAGV
jgi:hypothetical protein